MKDATGRNFEWILIQLSGLDQDNSGPKKLRELEFEI